VWTLKDRAFYDVKHDNDHSIVRAYFGCMDNEQSISINKQMTEEGGNLRCLICTISFGMGIDVPDLDMVIHWGMSSSIANYWQEVGRAGRGGQSAVARLFVVRKMMRGLDEDMKKLATNLRFNKVQCFRQEIMGALTLDGMPEAVTPVLQCANKCDKCTCTFCSWCLICKWKCKCIGK